MWKYLCRTAAGHLLLLSLREVKAAGIILEVIGLGFVDHLRAMTAMSMEVSVAAIRGDHDQGHHYQQHQQHQQQQQQQQQQQDQEDASDNNEN